MNAVRNYGDHSPLDYGSQDEEPLPSGGPHPLFIAFWPIIGILLANATGCALPV